MLTFVYHICLALNFFFFPHLASSAPINPQTSYSEVDLERRAVTVVPSPPLDSPRIFGTTASLSEPLVASATAMQESAKGSIIVVTIVPSDSPRVLPTAVSPGMAPIAPTTLHQSGRGTVIILPPNPTASVRVYPSPTGTESLSGFHPIVGRELDYAVERRYIVLG